MREMIKRNWKERAINSSIPRINLSENCLCSSKSSVNSILFLGTARGQTHSTLQASDVTARIMATLLSEEGNHS
jgi:hypothetical protein